MNGRALVCVLGLAAFSVAAACSVDSAVPPGSSPGGSGGAGGGAGAAGGNSGTSGTGGAAGIIGSTGGSSGSSGVDAGDAAPGTGGAQGDASSGESGPVTGTRRHGKSPGCGMPAGMAGGQTLTIPKCVGCSAAMGNCPRDCIAPEFAPRAGGNVDFTTRSYSLALPAGYDPNTASE